MCKKNSISIAKNDCVACGACVKICPKNALSIYKGLYATVNKEACVGCLKCLKECPASVIKKEGDI